MKTDKKVDNVWIVLKTNSKPEEKATYFVRQDDQERLAEKIKRINESKKYISENISVKGKRE